jgi:hypothetical protein
MEYRFKLTAKEYETAFKVIEEDNIIMALGPNTEQYAIIPCSLFIYLFISCLSISLALGLAAIGMSNPYSNFNPSAIPADGKYPVTIGNTYLILINVVNSHF